ncbi:CpaD family pilus assembly protein [Sphingosinicella terrae]|uniref:CpaD family pilus assembly protein n=1 Tax=Sphingosinicella terrae TaxID=2172047 RepID=UPI0013B37912|nr:CpaD family pilus assembly lipoprotein [Sphingosinicella terrae]
MSRTRTLIAIVAVGVGTAACETAPTGLQVNANPSVYSVHQPVVQRTDYVLDVATSGDGVAPTELTRLDAWLRSIDARYGDAITIDEGYGYGAPGARTAIAGVAARYGLLLDSGPPITPGEVPAGTVRVVASRATASVPGCPIYTSSEQLPTSYTDSNYGCATNSNLAAMVANPNDLVQGQDGGVDRSASTATRAIGTYREVQPTGRQGLQQSSTTGGN